MLLGAQLPSHLSRQVDVEASNSLLAISGRSEIAANSFFADLMSDKNPICMIGPSLAS